MTISKRFLLHVMFLLCDVTALVASAQVDNYVMFSSQNKDHRPAESSSVVEYHFDHEITEKQARDNLRSMAESDFQTQAYCKPCSDEHKRYCHSENLLKDHCCCNQGHKKEQLYFIPHTCYINEERCHTSLGSCLTTMEIRNCCCDAQLKRQWRSVLSAAYANRSRKYLSLILATLVAVFVY